MNADTATPFEGRLAWPDLRNARDLGGLETSSGLQIQPRALVRSDTLTRLTPVGQQVLFDYGVRTVIDLRDPPLATAQPHPYASQLQDSVVAYRYLSLLPEDFSFPVPLEGGYEMALDQSPAAIIWVLRTIIEAQPGGVLFHCHSGTGRTGLVALIVLSLCTVLPEMIRKDYLRSYTNEGDRLRGDAEIVVPNVLDYLGAHYGGAASYVRQAGFSDSELSKLRERLLIA